MYFKMSERRNNAWGIVKNIRDHSGTARSVITLLLDFLIRLQRLPRSFQAPHQRIPPT